MTESDRARWRVRVRPETQGARGAWAADRYDKAGGWESTDWFASKNDADKHARLWRRRFRSGWKPPTLTERAAARRREAPKHEEAK